MKKTHLFTVLFTVLATLANAQSNVGTDYFGLGEMQTAKNFFLKQVAQSPAESNYYLGEIAFAEGNMDEAKSFYEKGIAASPLYMLNYVGQGKLLLKSNQKEAELSFATALKKNKKDVAVNVAIARAYYECGMKDIALAKIEVARKYGKKSPLVYILEGDILNAEGKPGDAAGKYEQAIYFDPNCTLASIKCAEVYGSINPALSVDMLKKVLVAHPDYTIAYRDLGNCYALSGNYSDAIESYKTYFAEGKYTVEDITKFASAYYFTDQFAQSKALVDEGLQRDSANFVLNRFRLYNASKLKDGINGITYADYFFTLQSEKGFIPLDYMAYAVVLTEAGQFEKALAEFNKLLDSDSNKAEVFKEMSSLYGKMGDKGKSADTYKEYMDLKGHDLVDALDYNTLARAYYSAGSALLSDTTQLAKALSKDYLLKADSTFGVVCTLAPDSYAGFLWRGHTNALLDPETTLGLAKPYYEAAANLILGKENGAASFSRDLKNCYKYLGYYYYLKEDKENSIKYWKLLLELDPNNANAKMVLDEYNKPAKK